MVNRYMILRIMNLLHQCSKLYDISIQTSAISSSSRSASPEKNIKTALWISLWYGLPFICDSNASITCGFKTSCCRWISMFSGNWCSSTSRPNLHTHKTCNDASLRHVSIYQTCMHAHRVYTLYVYYITVRRFPIIKWMRFQMATSTGRYVVYVQKPKRKGCYQMHISFFA